MDVAGYSAVIVQVVNIFENSIKVGVTGELNKHGLITFKFEDLVIFYVGSGELGNAEL